MSGSAIVGSSGNAEIQTNHAKAGRFLGFFRPRPLRAVCRGTSPVELSAQTAVAIDNDDIGGVVTGPGGPEAGVWVIAETTDLGTKMSKMVVTDDQGRYVLPDLPKAKYKVWVRGYWLVDSPKVDSEPGKQLNLTAVIAPNEKAAVEYYPAIYWFSMIHVPGTDQFPLPR